MTTSSNTPFVPVLTVMVDYGNAPFLWLVDNPEERGVGGNLCDSTYWDMTFPMSEGLWRKFADWAIEFDRTTFDPEGVDDRNWDWIAFHARGLHQSRSLKEEVGDAYHVVYDKLVEDPNYRVDQCTEILADGTLLPLSPFRGSFPDPIRFCERIVSGGQTGADRGALDFAIKHSYTHGGWAPRGREAEDGLIPLRYQLFELADGGYRQRTRRNVEDSDGTLIVNLGELNGGTLATHAFALKFGRQCLVVQLDAGVTVAAAANVLAWLREHGIKTLNVAGPRASKRPGVYRLTRELLEAVDAALHQT